MPTDHGKARDLIEELARSAGVFRLEHFREDPVAAAAIGERGRRYVAEHSLVPDGIADYLMCIDGTLRAARSKRIPKESIISFHPWTKPGKRRWLGGASFCRSITAFVA